MLDQRANSGAFFLHVFALSGFAVAQPIYDWVSAQPEFLVAHGFDLVAAAFLVGLLSFAVPAVLAAAASGLRLVGPRALGASQALTVGVLTGLFAMQLVTTLGSWAAVTVGVAVAAVAGIAYAGVHVTRTFLSITALGAAAFPLIFLLTQPVRGMVLPRAIPDFVLPAASATPDEGVVFLVLDELPLSALLENEREIDGERFPNFARLAAESTWYPNATAVHIGTTRALPALLSGRIPPDRRGALPRWEDHPDNLFLWAARTYGNAVVGSEPMTRLCPHTICPRDHVSRGAALLTLTLDVSVLLGHRVLPERQARERLPEIDNRWHNFVALPGRDPGAVGEFPGAESDRSEEWRRSIAGLGPGFNFLHILLPHDPYVYLPDGTRYRARTQGIDDDDVWRTEGLHLLEYQRFMAQLQYTDHLLGEMIDRLEEEGLWDSSLVIVVADHGKSFRLGEHKRRVASATLEDVLNVPFFIKTPGQSEGSVDEYRASVIDLAPTIADVVGRDLPWETDGGSLIAEARPPRDSIPVSCLGGTCSLWLRQHEVDGRIHLDPAEIASTNALAWKREHIAWSEGAGLFVPADLDVDLLGREVSELAVAEEPSVAVEIRDHVLFEHLQPGLAELPALVRGSVALPPEETGARLAVALNGRIAGLTRAVTWDDAPGYFAALLPRSGFRESGNDLEVFRIEAGGSEPILARLGVRDGTAGVLRDVAGSPVLIPYASASEYRIDDEAVQGWVDQVVVEGDVVRIGGWAADMEGRRPVEAVMGFRAERSFARVAPSHDRSGVVELAGTDSVNPAGFQVAVPRRTLEGLPARPMFYGISGEDRAIAGRLRYTSRTGCMIDLLPEDPADCDPD